MQSKGLEVLAVGDCEYAVLRHQPCVERERLEERPLLGELPQQRVGESVDGHRGARGEEEVADGGAATQQGSELSLRGGREGKGEGEGGKGG